MSSRRLKTMKLHIRRKEQNLEGHVEIPATASQSCRNCSQIAVEVRGLTFFFISLEHIKDRRLKSIAIATWQQFLDAKDCTTCKKLVRYFVSSVQQAKRQPEFLLRIYS